MNSSSSTQSETKPAALPCQEGYLRGYIASTLKILQENFVVKDAEAFKALDLMAKNICIDHEPHLYMLVQETRLKFLAMERQKEDIAMTSNLSAAMRATQRSEALAKQIQQLQLTRLATEAT